MDFTYKSYTWVPRLHTKVGSPLRGTVSGLVLEGRIFAFRPQWSLQFAISRSANTPTFLQWSFSLPDPGVRVLQPLVTVISQFARFRSANTLILFKLWAMYYYQSEILVYEPLRWVINSQWLITFWSTFNHFGTHQQIKLKSSSRKSR